MKTLISFGLASLVVFSCHAQTNNDIKYKHLVYQQAMNGMFFKEGKVFFIIDCQLQQVVKLHDSTFYLFARTGTAASGKKRFTSIDTIIIHNDILEYNANFFNLDTVNTNDYQLMASLEKRAKAKEEADMNYLATTALGDNQKFSLSAKENDVFPDYYTESVEKSKIRYKDVGYTSTAGGRPSNAISEGTYTGNGRSTYQVDNGTYVGEEMEQFKGKLTNRTVKSKAVLTSEAGTFSCWVVEGQVEKYKNITVVDYFAPEVGLVKREFKRRGKTYSSLTLIKASM